MTEFLHVCLKHTHTGHHTLPVSAIEKKTLASQRSPNLRKSLAVAQARTRTPRELTTPFSEPYSAARTRRLNLAQRERPCSCRCATLGELHFVPGLEWYHLAFRLFLESPALWSSLRFRKFPGKLEGVWCSILATLEFP